MVLPALKRSRDPSAYCEVEIRPALSWSRGHVIRYVLIGIDGCLWRSVCLIGIYGRLFGREAFQSRARRAPLLDCLWSNGYRLAVRHKTRYEAKGSRRRGRSRENSRLWVFR